MRRALLLLALCASALAGDLPGFKEGFRQAWLLEVDGDDPKAAAEAYRKVEEGFPDSGWFAAAARVRRAACLLRLGQAKEARDLVDTFEPPPEFSETVRGILAAAAPPPPEPDEAEIRTLCARLGDSNYDVREATQKRLSGMGSKALPALRRARETAKDPEIRERLAWVIDALEGEEVWVGYYRQGGREYPFTLVLKPGALGAFSGRILEPSMDWGEGETMDSEVSGTRDAQGVFAFVKQYGNGGPRWSYEGRMKDGRVQGRYAEGEGTEFVLRREWMPTR